MTPSARTCRIPTLLAPAFDNSLSLGYLLVVAGAAAVFVDSAITTHDLSFSGMLLLLVTAPFGVLTIPVHVLLWDSPVAGPALMPATALAAALVNAAFLGRMVRANRRPAVGA
ncbi:SCO4225 family membrane protein [Kitasatospora sp. NPDC048365]|uniref:SCO4225 family membrane protein n=1 Tax=Kitasatospora sp. NPDC048365 TaxID=3364050 RepID=UPI0037230EFF